MPDKINKLDDALSKLKTSVTATKTSKVDAALDKAVKDITAYKANSGRRGYIDLVKHLISKNASFSIGGASGGLFSQGVTPSAFGQGSRIMRYKTYEAIVSQINYCHRALQVLVDNIVSPDDITKVALEVKPKTFLEDEIPTESRAQHVKQIIKVMKIEEKLPLIIRSTLQYGDFFCELADPKTALTSRTVLAEGEKINGGLNESSKETLTYNTGKDNIKVIIDYTLHEKGDYAEYQSKEKQLKIKNLRNLKTVFHNPQFVLKLQSALFPVCMGYLIFPQMAVSPSTTLQDEAINNICASILKNLQSKIPQMKDFKNDDELKAILSSMLAHSDPNKAVEIRYVPPDLMVHFMIPTTKYYPYGESIFDSSQYSAKVLIALETALAIQRLSRSTEKRKIAVEIGLPRDARKAIEQLKEEFRKRKISLDSFGTVDTIPSMITTFEDIYIPQKDGKQFVDVSTFQEGNVDVRGKVDELKFMRDQLVSSLGIPPAFIGIEENLSNKAALSEENILFARTVIGHQKYLTHQVRDLVEKIYKIIDPEEALTILDNVDVSLPTPRSLQYEREARYMSELANLVETLDRIGIPKEYAKVKYLSQIDWKEVEKYEMDEKIEKTLDPEKKKEDEGGEFGMGGLGGGDLGVGGAGF